MNLINKKVKHKHFGTGSIVKHNDKFVEIHFGDEHKKFLFPDVFEKHVKLLDQSAANSLEKVMQEKLMQRRKEEEKREQERKRLQEEQQLRMEYEKLMKNHKLHPESQLVFWCDQEEKDSVFSEWNIFLGEIKSGKNEGKPNKAVRLHQNSACLLTERDSDVDEKERRILGVYMVGEDFIGKLSEDGYVPAHSEYRIVLTEEEADQMPFWKYYVNERAPHRMTWNSGKFRYFDNEWMAQIMRDIISIKTDPEEKALAERFFNHFCKMNQIREDELSEPNGALMRS